MSVNGNSYTVELTREVPIITNSRDYFNRLQSVVRDLDHERVDEIAEVLLQAHAQGRRVFLFGNGGSASLASHFACDLGKGATSRDAHMQHFKAIALTDNIPMITAWANDCGYEDVFARQLQNLIQPGDLVFAISASGNSPNILKALEYGREVGAYRVGLTGFKGGKMRKLCDICLVVPSENMQLIEDVHLSIAHSLFTVVRSQLQLDLQGAGAKSAVAAM
jgi:D-sedoheptulose 7-phosphate isomerase